MKANSIPHKIGNQALDVAQENQATQPEIQNRYTSQDIGLSSSDSNIHCSNGIQINDSDQNEAKVSQVNEKSHNKTLELNDSLKSERLESNKDSLDTKHKD